MKTKRLAAVGLAAALMVAASGGGVVAAGRAPSPAPCGSARRASVTALSASGRVRWRVSLPHPGDFGTAAPLVEGETMYADLSGGVSALSVQTGRVDWRRSIGTDVYGEWMIGATLVVDVDQVGPHAQIDGLDPRTGAVEWRYRSDGGWYGDPVPAGTAGLVLVHDRRLLLLDAATGRPAWTKSLAHAGQPVADSTTVAVDPAGTLEGFDVATGDRTWTAPDTRTGTTALPTLDDGVAALASDTIPSPGNIAGYDLASGRRLWTLPLNQGAWALSATSAGLVALQDYPTDSGGIDLIDPRTGRFHWRSTLGQPAFTEVTPQVEGADLSTVVDRPVHGPTSILTLDVRTGKVVAEHRFPDRDVPLALAADGSGLYGAGLGLPGRAEDGFAERLGQRGVIWRVVLPQPAQTAPVALPGGGVAEQTEDLACGIV